ncbi:MAG: DJ-1/PfpI family protein [archaeon]
MIKLAFIVTDNFRDAELIETKSALSFSQKPKFEVDIASNTMEQLYGADGGKATPKLLIEDIAVDNYDGIVLIGGPGMAEVLNNDTGTTQKIIEKVQAFNSAKKLVAAICITPLALAKANIVKDKQLTAWNGDGKQREAIEAAGGMFTETKVVADNNILTACGPAVAHNFGNAIREYFVV